MAYNPSANHLLGENNGHQTYEQQIKAQQDMQQQQLQAQIDLQNQIIKNHNESIAQHQQQQLQQLQAQSGHYNSGNNNPYPQQQQSYPPNSGNNHYEQPQQTYQQQQQHVVQEEKHEEDQKQEEEDPNAGWKIAAGIGGGLLAAAGMAYGGYKLNQHIKEKKHNEDDEQYHKNLAMHSNSNTPRMPTSNQAGYSTPSQTMYGGAPPSSHGSNYSQHSGYRN